MTTDLEIAQALERDRNGETLDREWLFSAYLETAERREKLAPLLCNTAQLRYDFCNTKRWRWHEGGYGVTDVLRKLDRFLRAIDGTEHIDFTRVRRLHSDLQAIDAEYRAIRINNSLL